MMSNKKNICLAFLFTITIFSSYSMENRYQQFKKTIRNILRGREQADVLLPQQLNEPNEPQPSFQLFTNLPKDIQHYIINLLILYNTTKSMKEAAFIINSLAQVNKELNATINDDKFCLQLIKYLAKKFNVSDQEVATSLQTQEAKQRMQLQNDLYQLCTSFSPEELPHSLSLLIELGVDLEFTYQIFGGGILTPLHIACTVNNGILKQLCTANNENKNKLFNINRRNEQGETALFICIKDNLIDNIKILLDAGAHPEIPDYNGKTPLQMAEEIGNEEVIELIKNAIEKYKK